MRTRLRVLMAVLSVAVLALVLLIGHVAAGGYWSEVASRFGERGQPLPVTDLHDIGQLQAAFNQDAGTPRLLVLFSPT